ncbi:hypothetical protein FRC09_014646, partial [Ceratobasidium sp. 395]
EDGERGLPDFGPNDDRDYNFDKYFANPVRFADRNMEDLGHFMDSDINRNCNEDGLDERDEYDVDFGLPDQGDGPDVDSCLEL